MTIPFLDRRIKTLDPAILIALARLWPHVARQPDGCLVWTRRLTRQGYAEVQIEKVRTFVHRVFYLAYVGPVPDGLELDHLCRNRACCEPSHLEAVTHWENTSRGNSPAGVNSRKTHCNRGHPFDDANTYRFGGKRACRTCIAMNSRAHQERKRICEVRP